MMTSSLLTSVLLLLAGLAVVLATNQTEREARQAVVVSETMQVMTNISPT